MPETGQGTADTAVNQTFKFPQSKGTRPAKMPFTILLRLLPEVVLVPCSTAAAILPLQGKKSHHTEDDRASKQKETSLNECEQLKAPKQFTFSSQGFSTSNSQSLLSES